MGTLLTSINITKHYRKVRLNAEEFSRFCSLGLPTVLYFEEQCFILSFCPYHLLKLAKTLVCPSFLASLLFQEDASFLQPPTPFLSIFSTKVNTPEYTFFGIG